MHGFEGPVNISSGTHRCKRAEDTFIEAADALGYSELKDLQNLDANNGTERWMKYVGPNGRRQDSAHRYIHPKLRSGQYPNLHVICDKQVIKVLFDDNKRAVGVEYQTNPKSQPNPEFMVAKQTPRTVRAKKMVVVSAGANGTPLILERSGVGDAKILQRAGVPMIQELPGVGNDYQDHHLTLYAYRTSLTKNETINAFSDGRFDLQEAIRANHELLGTNAMDACKINIFFIPASKKMRKISNIHLHSRQVQTNRRGGRCPWSGLQSRLGSRFQGRSEQAFDDYRHVPRVLRRPLYAPGRQRIRLYG